MEVQSDFVQFYSQFWLLSHNNKQAMIKLLFSWRANTHYLFYTEHLKKKDSDDICQKAFVPTNDKIRISSNRYSEELNKSSPCDIFTTPVKQWPAAEWDAFSKP